MTADATFLHHLRDEIDAEIAAQEGTTGGTGTGGGDSGGGTTGGGALAISPTTAHPGDTVTITGSGFGAVAGEVALWISWRGTIVSWSDTKIVFTLPTNITAGNHNVYINGVWLLTLNVEAGTTTGGGDTGGGTGGTGDGDQGGIGYVSGGNGAPIIVNYRQINPATNETFVSFPTVAGMSLEMIEPVHPARKSEQIYQWNNPNGNAPPLAYFGDSIPDSEMVVRAQSQPFSAKAPGFLNAELWTHGRMLKRFVPAALPDGALGGTLDLTGEKNGPLVLDLYAWNSLPNTNPSDGMFREGKQRVILFVEGGTDYVAPTPPAAAGMHIVFRDEFDAPLSVSKTDPNARWYPSKPEPTGEGQFGSGIFVDPDNLKGAAASPFYQRGSFLRIRAKYEPHVTDPFGWDRVWTTGMLATGKPGGQGGFYAEVPYYAECRFMAPTGGVPWPAFWQLTKEGLMIPGHGNVETDTIEAIGLFPGLYRAGEIYYPAAGGAVGLGPPKAQPASYPNDSAFFDFHTYGCLVTKEKTEYFLDDVSLGSVETKFLDGVSTRSDFFMINLGFGGGGWDYLNSTLPGTDHYDMWVDFIRVWRP